MNLPTPTVEYDLLSPMLIVFGVAIAGVLVEAFLPRTRRYGAQLVLCLGGLAAALVAVVLLARDLHGAVGRPAVMGAVVIDTPALFLQATILLVAVLGILLIAERQIGAQPEGGNGARGLTRSHRRHPRFPAPSPSNWPPRPASSRPKCSR